MLEGGDAMSEAYDEGRLTERLLTGATMLGFGGGVAWFGEPDQQAEAKRILGIPGRRDRAADRDGRPSDDRRRPASLRAEARPQATVRLVSYDRWGATKQK